MFDGFFPSSDTAQPRDPQGDWGLFTQAEQPVPLRSRAVCADVFAEHAFASYTETLRYSTEVDCSARFSFPLPPRASVYKFTATIGDRTIVTQVKRRQEAQTEYNEAVSQGHAAVQMQQAVPGTSLYRVDLGNLAEGEDAVITFSYVRLLNSVAGAVEFEHQATWVPPYSSAAVRDPGGADALAAADAAPAFSGSVSYTLSYDVTIRSSRGFRTIDSSRSLSVAEDGPHVRTVHLDESVSDASRDLSILIELPRLKANKSNTGQLLRQTCIRPSASKDSKPATDKQKTIALATFVPRLPVSSPQAPPTQREIIFVVDGSGSMQGSPIIQALEAALFFVKDLPLPSEGVKSGSSSSSGASLCFNAVVFGSRHVTMWPASRPYDAKSQSDAMQWLQESVHPNYGGTELLPTLTDIYENMPLKEGATRQVVLLTDGGISATEEQAIYDLLRGIRGSKAACAAAARTTVFSLGIGHGVHRGLVEGMASHSGGVSQFVLDGEAIRAKAGMLQRCALAVGGGCLVQPRLEAKSCVMRTAPHVLPPRLFPDEPLHVLMEVMDAKPGACIELVASLPSATSLAKGGCDKGDAKDEVAQYRISLALDQAVQVPGDALAVLHAMGTISCLLDGTSSMHRRADGSALAIQPDQCQVEDAVVAIACEEGLVTLFTSAVGVCLRRDPLDPDTVQPAEVPLQYPANRTLWQEDELARSAYRQKRFHSMAHSANVGFRGRRLGYVQQAQDIMQQNISACISRGEAIEQLETRSLTLHQSAEIFRKKAMPRRSCQQQNFAVAMVSAIGRGLGRLFTSVGGTAAAPASASEPTSLPAAPCESKKNAAESRASKDFRGGAVRDAVVTGCISPSVEAAPAMARLDATATAQAGDPLLRSSAEVAVAVDTPEQVLSLLNLRRTVHGSVPATTEVLQALVQRSFSHLPPILGAPASASPPPTTLGIPGGTSLAEAATALLRGGGVRPSFLQSDDAWVTVLALSYLRKHLSGQQELWKGLEAKALDWLAGVWPAEMDKSIGSAILAAMKLV